MVVTPDSIKIYPVEIGSILALLISGDAVTCLPIRCSEFLPLITDRKSIASAIVVISFMLAGKIIKRRHEV